VEPSTLHSSLAALGDQCRYLRDLGLEHLRVLQAENTGLIQQVEVLSAEQQASTSVVQQLRNSLVQAENQAVAADRRAAKLSDQLSDQQETLAAGQSALRSEIKSLAKDLEDKTRDNERLRQLVSDHVTQYDQLCSQSRLADGAIQALQQRTSELEHQLNVKTESLAQAEQSREELQRCADEHRLQGEARSTELAQLRQELASVSGEKGALQQRSAELEHLLNAKSEALTQAEQTRNDYQKHSADLQHQLTTRTAELKQLRDDLASVRGEKDALQQHIVELEHLLKAKAEALTQAQQTCNNHQKHAEELQQELLFSTAEAEKELSCQREAYAEAASAINELKLQVVAHDQRLSAASQRIEFLSLQRSELQEELEEAYLADREKQQQLNSSEEQAANFCSQLHAAIQAHECQNDRIAELQRTLSIKDERLNEIKGRSEDQTRQLETLHSRNELLQLQVHELQDELEQAFLLTHDQQRPALDTALSSQPADLAQAPSQPVSASHVINNHRSRLLTTH
jgi:chromosome segregation ATPase